MNPQITRLYEIAGKDNRIVLGLMSGTSIDGLDLALCRISGSGLETKLQLENWTSIEFPQILKDEISVVFAKPFIDFNRLCVLNPYIGIRYAEIVLDTLEKWQVNPREVDLIASHGQTVFHTPKSSRSSDHFPNATLQIGDGDHIARKTGIITVSDFRQKHVAAGGEGAPLAVYGDYILFSNRTENRILLNLGGMANFTFLPRDFDSSRVFTTDTGPANTLLDRYCMTHFNQGYDKNGQIARKGNQNSALLRELLSHEFFRQNFPKSTGPEAFNLEFLNQAIRNVGATTLSKEDVLATLTVFTAESVALAIRQYPGIKLPTTVYVSGGGARNEFLIEKLTKLLNPVELKPVADLGIPGDAKEAVLFALLANELVAAPKPLISGNSEIPAVQFGKISFPE